MVELALAVVAEGGAGVLEGDGVAGVGGGEGVAGGDGLLHEFLAVLASGHRLFAFDLRLPAAHLEMMIANLLQSEFKLNLRIV